MSFQRISLTSPPKCSSWRLVAPRKSSFVNRSESNLRNYICKNDEWQMVTMVHGDIKAESLGEGEGEVKAGLLPCWVPANI